MSDKTKRKDVQPDEGTSKALREHAACLKKKLTEAEARIADLENQLADRVLAEHLSDFRNPGLVEQAMRDDGVDPLNKREVATWLAENGDAFAKAGQTPSERVYERAQEVTAEQQAAAEAFAELQSTQGSLTQPLGEQAHFEAFLESTGLGVWSAPIEDSEEQR